MFFSLSLSTPKPYEGYAVDQTRPRRPDRRLGATKCELTRAIALLPVVADLTYVGYALGLVHLHSAPSD